jgi:hypothetical protein
LFNRQERKNEIAMIPIQLASQEWEANTQPHPKMRLISEFRPEYRLQPFRRYGYAIAWLEWYESHIEIRKFEALEETGRGSAGKLIRFLIALSNKYKIPIEGQAVPYPPDPPALKGETLTLEQLETFYKKHGFTVRTIDSDRSDISYFPPE